MTDVRISTSWGEFIGPDSDLIVSTLKANTLWDGQGFLQPLCREWARFGEVGTTVLDVGAHFGYFTCWLAAQGAWRVVAVEPMPETYRYLQMNLDLNKGVCAERVIPLKAAAYGRCQLLRPTPLAPGNWGGRALRAAQPLDPDVIVGIPLDRYRFLFGERVSLIKIDAEGCDGQVLAGLMGTICKDKPVVIFEWDAEAAVPHQIALSDAISTLKAYGYDVHEWPTHPNNYLALPRGAR